MVSRAEIERRVESYPVPHFLASFLREHWHGTLEHVYLKDGDDSDAWTSAVTTLEDLVWSVQPKRSTGDRKHLVALLPSLLTKGQAEATTAAAQASVAPQAAQAAVDKAQADADKSRADVAETQRRIANMPTEQQAQAAIDLGLNDKQADLNAKQQALEQARQLLPGAVAQQQANIGQTQATTQSTLATIQKGVQGPLYGIGGLLVLFGSLILYDLVVRRRPHPVSWIGALAILASLVAAGFLAFSGMGFAILHGA